jgi:hypothetical protein
MQGMEALEGQGMALRGRLCWLLGHRYEGLSYEHIHYAYCRHCLDHIYVKS